MAPQLLAVLELEANEITRGADGVNAIVVDGRGGARSLAKAGILAGVTHVVGAPPDRLARIGVEADHDLAARFVEHRHQAAFGNRHRGVTAAQLRFPDLWRP